MLHLLSNKFKCLIILYIICAGTTVSAQYDMQWLFGYGQEEDFKFGLTLIDFNEGEVEVSYYSPAFNEYFRLGYAGSFICDTAKQLELISNHCKIYDRNFTNISGNSIITPTGLSDNCVQDEGNGSTYGSYQSFIFLPDLENSSKTYVLHKDMHIDFENQDLYTKNFWFSTITKNEETFDFQKKYIINDKRLHVESLTAIPNKQKNGWWVVMPHQNSNAFDRYLIRSDTVIKLDTQRIGLSYHVEDIGIGQAAFSPNGNYFAKNSEAHGVLLYEFDTETGRLSNFRTIPYPDSRNVAKGLCFSPNERFIYVTTAENMYQIDLTNNDEIYDLGYERSFDEFGWPVDIGMIFSGPDCKLYVSPGSSTNNLHVILEPDQKGMDCQFNERAIELPSRIPHHLPNIPQYRYLSGCDSTIHFPFLTNTVHGSVSDQKQIDIYPNPVSTELKLIYPRLVEQHSLILVNIHGQKVMDIWLKRGTDQLSIDLSSIVQGVYWIMDPVGNFETVKFVKM